MDWASRHRHELLGDVERQRPLIIQHLRARDGGLILRRLQPVLALLAALDRVADAQIELRVVVEVARRCELGRSNSGMNCESQERVGFGRRLAVISCARF